MKHFNENRELVQGPPEELWDDIEYMETMDTSWHHWMQPRWDKEREALMKKLKGESRDKGERYLEHASGDREGNRRQGIAGNLDSIG